MSDMLCTICARGGSKGVKNKNIRKIGGKPLISYTIEQAKKTGLFRHIVVSTDNDDIIEISKKYGAEVFFKRDISLANDTAGKLEAIKDAFVRSEQHYGKRFDYLIDLDATAPLRRVEDIVNSFNQFKENDNDNLITAAPSRRSPYFNLIEQDKEGKVRIVKKINRQIVRRQDVPKTYDMNASIYIWKRNAILNEKTIFLEKTGLYIMSEERSIDIDSELDFRLVEFLIKNSSDC